MSDWNARPTPQAAEAPCPHGCKGGLVTKPQGGGYVCPLHGQALPIPPKQETAMTAKRYIVSDDGGPCSSAESPVGKFVLCNDHAALHVTFCELGVKYEQVVAENMKLKIALETALYCLHVVGSPVEAKRIIEAAMKEKP